MYYITYKVTQFEIFALNPLKVAKERFPFFRLEVEFVCFSFISFFQKAKKMWKFGNFISQLTLPNTVYGHETGEIILQFCI